jgi:hypothetical protein
MYTYTYKLNDELNWGPFYHNYSSAFQSVKELIQEHKKDNWTEDINDNWNNIKKPLKVTLTKEDKKIEFNVGKIIY